VDSARNAAITSLGGSNDPRAVRVLVDSARDPLARDAALASLARTGGAEAERALTHAAESQNADERAAAARALTGETPAAMVPKLASLARDADANVADAAFQALRTAAPQDALAVATEGLRSADPAARAASVGRAGELDPEVARPILIQATHDADPDVVTAAASALGNAGGAEAQQALLDVLTSSSSSDDVRRAAAEALQSMGGAGARDHAELIAKWVDTGEGDDESP
jgi:HEAT repeat protein